MLVSIWVAAATGCANFSIRLRVMLGARRASPWTTWRTAVMSRSCGAVVPVGAHVGWSIPSERADANASGDLLSGRGSGAAIERSDSFERVESQARTDDPPLIGAA
jgi:hypothetical protein